MCTYYIYIQHLISIELNQFEFYLKKKVPMIGKIYFDDNSALLSTPAVMFFLQFSGMNNFWKIWL